MPWRCVIWRSESLQGVKICTVLFLASMVLSIYFFRHFCCRMYRLAINHSERLKSWQASTAPKADFSFKMYRPKQVNTHADHGYSRQRSVALRYIVGSTIGYHSNNRASCYTADRLQWRPIPPCTVDGIAERLSPGVTKYSLQVL